MRILGIDYGDARTGLSISDPSGFLAGSPSVIHEWNYAKLVDKLVAFIQENKIEEIVLGHPKNMDGTVGPRAEKCETLAKELEERTGLHEAEFIETRRHWFTGITPHTMQGGVEVLNLVEGDAAVIESPAGTFEPFTVHYAETFIIPASIGSYTIRPLVPGTFCGTVKAYVRH